MGADRIVVVGRIGHAFGIKGWSHVHSFTDPVANLLDFDELYVRLVGNSWSLVESTSFQRRNEGLIAQFNDCADRSAAERLTNLELGIRREQLPELASGEFYWIDLIGLDVVNLNNVKLGEVNRVIENGASSVLDIEGQDVRYLIPLVKPILDSVCLGSHVRVDWHESWKA